MNALLILFSLLSGGYLLYMAGDILVENSKRLGLLLKIEPMVIGITIVAFGTSAPELFVSAQGALFGQPDLAIGNVVGSCIANILLILGLSAVLCAIPIARRTVYIDLPIVLGSSALLFFLSLDLVISRFDGVMLVVLLGAFIKNELGKAKASRTVDEYKPEFGDTPRKLALYIVGSLIGLMIGSNLLIYGATEVARIFGMSELVIGLTIVAIGTSLPEVVTSCIAAKKGESSIAVGNVIGSNIFNVLGVMGISAILTPVPVAIAALSFDMPVMLLSTLLCFMMAISGRVITRGEGRILLGFYAGYLFYLVLIAKQHASMPVVSELTGIFALPLVPYYFYEKRMKFVSVFRNFRRTKDSSTEGE